MKPYSIKNFCGQKTLIINDFSKVDVEVLFLEASKLGIPFAIKKEFGIQIWGLFTVAKYLGIRDSSTLLKKINNEITSR